MEPSSPFGSLQIPRNLVCEFFAVFARFEFALKELGFSYVNRGRVSPDWDGFAKAAADDLQFTSDTELAEAIAYLNREPPQVQVSAQKWEAKPLRGIKPVATAINATQRVRNNLFHGGKHTKHSPPERDEQLVRCSLVILYACLEQNRELRAAYG